MAPIVVVAFLVSFLHVQFNKVLTYCALVASFNWSITLPILYYFSYMVRRPNVEFSVNRSQFSCFSHPCSMSYSSSSNSSLSLTGHWAAQIYCRFFHCTSSGQHLFKTNFWFSPNSAPQTWYSNATPRPVDINTSNPLSQRSSIRKRPVFSNDHWL